MPLTDTKVKQATCTHRKAPPLHGAHQERTFTNARSWLAADECHSISCAIGTFEG